MLNCSHVFRRFSATDVIPHDRRAEFAAAIFSSRTRELVRSRTSATKSGEIKEIRKAADLLDTSSFQQPSDTSNNSFESGTWDTNGTSGSELSESRQFAQSPTDISGVSNTERFDCSHDGPRTDDGEHAIMSSTTATACGTTPKRQHESAALNN